MARVSVIVPARGAAATLPACLAALAAQEGVEPEVVVVEDDGPSPMGPSAARNAGLRRAQGEVVAFTDADCAPAPRWLAAALAAVDAGADVVQGPVVPPPGVHVGPFDRTVRVERPSPLFECANLVVRRAWLDRVGGFPAGVRPARGGKELGEDVELGWRLRRAGARVAWAPEAVVHHAVEPRGPLAFVGEELRLVHFPALAARVPELRDALFWRRLFVHRRHAALALALAGAATGRPRVAAAAALPYARELHRVARPWGVRRGAGVAAVRTAADLVGIGAAVAGSVRARTPLV